MNVEDFNFIVEGELKRCQTTLVSKAAEYATEDRLHNFKVAATLAGCTPAQALGGMMIKHTVSIYDMIQEDGIIEHPMSVWTEKITDHLNYLLLLSAILHEEEMLKDDRVFEGQDPIPTPEPEGQNTNA